VKGDIKSEIKKFIIDNYLLGANDVSLSDDDSFLDKGIIDSIGVIELTHFLQRAYKIRIASAEIVPENFDTLNNLERYVTKKLEKK
jgi:acyl carrier protein